MSVILCVAVRRINLEQPEKVFFVWIQASVKLLNLRCGHLFLHSQLVVLAFVRATLHQPIYELFLREGVHCPALDKSIQIFADQNLSQQVLRRQKAESICQCASLLVHEP